MDYEVVTGPASVLQIAAFHDQATMAELASKIGNHVGTVIKVLQAAQIQFGRCVVLYWDHGDDVPLLRSAAGVPIDVGWEVAAAFTDQNSGVAAVQTPAGTAASTTHVGPYGDLHEAHSAIRRWCKQQGVQRLGPNWEVYDHQRDGQTPRTDVYYLIR